MGNTLFNNVKTVMLLSILSGIVIAAGYAIGGPHGAVIALVVAGVMNFASFFFSDKIALASMAAREVGPEHELYRIVEPLVQRAGLPMPRLYVSPQPAPNAFATGRNPTHAAVCATEGLLHLLNRNEVAAVMAHELAHVKHRDILITTVAATIGGAVSFLGNMFLYQSMFGGRDREDGDSPLGAVGGLLLMILGPVAAGIIQMAISRQREYAADTEGARLVGDPMHLARALHKIHVMADRVPMDVSPAFNALMIAEPTNFGATMAELFSTHPPLEKRMMNLIGRPSL